MMSAAKRKRIRQITGSWSELLCYPHISLSAPMTVTLAWCALVAAFVRGFDYVVLPQRSAVLSMVERAAPISEWGWLLIGGVILGAAGWLKRWWPVAIAGHAVLAGAAGALGAGLLISGSDDIAGVGLRDGAAFILIQAVVHALVIVALWREWDHQRRRP
jgi:hypothetical protein